MAAARRLHQKRHPVGYWSHVAWTEGFWLWSQSKWIQRHFWFKDTYFYMWVKHIYFFQFFFFGGWSMFLPWNVWDSWKVRMENHWFPPSASNSNDRTKNTSKTTEGPCFIGPLVSYPSKMVTWRVGVELRHQEFWAQIFLGATQKKSSPRQNGGLGRISPNWCLNSGLGIIGICVGEWLNLFIDCKFGIFPNQDAGSRQNDGLGWDPLYTI